MKNPLFKPPHDPLSAREEAEITQELAEAYRQNEADEKKPAFKRIVEKVGLTLSTNKHNE
ncbi:MAG: hypothetical protein WCO94_08240 [Verrucomicrobiota bacterium]